MDRILVQPSPATLVARLREPRSVRGSNQLNARPPNVRKVTVSMSRPGNCYDNACVESFFGTFKTELVHREHYRTRAEARSSVFEWIECWYNRRRRHSSLGYVSPEAFEVQSK